MGQGLTSEAALIEVTRMLNVALVLLDGTGQFVAAAHVAHALDLIALDGERNLVAISDSLADLDAFAPTWGDLVDRHPSAG